MTSRKAALVTGSTSGIGLGVARTLARSGVDVMLNGFCQRPEIERLRSGLERECGVEVDHSAADMSSADSIEGMIQDAEARFGGVDILVNNAGIQHVAPVESFPVAKWDEILAINLSSNFHAIRSVLPGMKRRGYGRIVNIASAHGLVASPSSQRRSPPSMG